MVVVAFLGDHFVFLERAVAFRKRSWWKHACRVTIIPNTWRCNTFTLEVTTAAASVFVLELAYSYYMLVTFCLPADALFNRNWSIFNHWNLRFDKFRVKRRLWWFSINFEYALPFQTLFCLITHGHHYFLLFIVYVDYLFLSLLNWLFCEAIVFTF